MGDRATIVPYAPVHLHHAAVIGADVASVWNIVCHWVPNFWIKDMNGVPIRFERVTGGGSASVGGIRRTEVGSTVCYEKLYSMDAEEHSLCWGVISDPRSINGFGAAFLEFKSRVRLFPLPGADERCVGEWNVDFYTDWQMADRMREAFSAWQRASFEALDLQFRPSQELLEGDYNRSGDPALGHRSDESGGGPSMARISSYHSLESHGSKGSRGFHSRE